LLISLLLSILKVCIELLRLDWEDIIVLCRIMFCRIMQICWG